MLPVQTRRKRNLTRAAALLACLLAAGCTGLKREPASAPAVPPAPEAPPQPPVPKTEQPGGPVLQGLPPEARRYLDELARAFAAQDTAFLIAQGERQYEEELRPQWDEESYLAMLYRYGDWAREQNRNPDPIPRLDPREIRDIEFLGWKEQGPLLEIQGRLITTGGADIPCSIVFNPRLKEPKILGLYP
jgi:hypothetical protein